MRHVQLVVSRLEIHSAHDPFKMLDSKLKAFGFDLTRTYSMYYDEANDSYVYFQKERVLH